MRKKKTIKSSINEILCNVNVTKNGTIVSNFTRFRVNKGTFSFSDLEKPFELFSYFIIKSIKNDSITIVYDNIARSISRTKKTTFSNMIIETNQDGKSIYGVKTITFSCL